MPDFSGTRSTLIQYLRSGLLKVLGALAGLFISILVARKLGVDNAGSFFYMLSLSMIFASVLRVGSDFLIVRHVARYYDPNGSCEDVNRFLSDILARVLLLGAIFLVVAFILDLIIVSRFEGYNTVTQAMFLAMSIAILYLQVFVFQGIQRPLLANFFMVFAPQALFLVLFLVFDVRSPASLILIYSASFIACIILANGFLGLAGITPHRLEFSHFGESLVSDWRQFYIQACIVLFAWSNIILVEWLSNPDEVSIYGVTSRVVMLVGFFLPIVNSVSNSRIAKAWADDDFVAVRTAYRASIVSLFIPAMGIASMLFLFPSAVMKIFGSEFVDGARVLVVLAAAQLVNAVYGSAATVLVMINRESESLRWFLVGLIANVALSIILIPEYGALGSSLAFGVGVVVYCMGHTFSLRAIIYESVRK